MSEDNKGVEPEPDLMVIDSVSDKSEKPYRVEIIDDEGEVITDEVIDLTENEMKLFSCLVIDLLPDDEGLAIFDENDESIDISTFDNILEPFTLGVLKENAEGSRAEFAEISKSLVNDKKITYQNFLLYFDDGVIGGYQFTDIEFFNAYIKCLDILERDDISETFRYYDNSGVCLQTI